MNSFILVYPCMHISMRAHAQFIHANIITIIAFLRFLLTLFRCVLGAPPQASIPYSLYGLMNALYRFLIVFPKEARAYS